MNTYMKIVHILGNLIQLYINEHIYIQLENVANSSSLQLSASKSTYKVVGSSHISYMVCWCPFYRGQVGLRSALQLP